MENNQADYITCQNCGFKLPLGYKHCPNCGADSSNSTGNGARICRNCQKRYSAAVYTCPDCNIPTEKYGFVQKSSIKKPFYKTVWFWIVIGVLFFSIVYIANREEKSEEKTEITIETTTQTYIPQSPSTQEPRRSPLDDNTIEVDISDCHITYLRHEIVENMGDELCVAIYYEFTNNSNSDKSFFTTVSDKAYQNGVELESSWFHVSDESKDSSKDIKPGVSIIVCSAFVLRDSKTNVELEVDEWISFDNSICDKMVLEIK